MRLIDIYQRAVAAGIKNDPRTASEIKKLLAEQKQAYEKLSDEEKLFFDREKLTNPFADTRIVFGDVNREVKTVLVGIDIDGAELLLTEQLRQQNKIVDAVISHHPIGRAYASFYEVMGVQSDIWAQLGVSVSVAEKLLGRRQKEVARRVLPQNHQRAVDIARHLNIALVCLHTPADNMVTAYLNSRINQEKPEKISDLLKLLEEIPEYRQAKELGSGPTLWLGDKNSRVGKVLVDMTGGTEGPADILEKLSSAGISTIVAMHLSEDHFKAAEKNNLNVIIAGHIASDTLGVNLLLDEVEKGNSRLKVIECSGFRRVNRNKR